jgi:23S rRNA G2069 N7-methylase RlmK/C1962 C5-methylase RlmI
MGFDAVSPIQQTMTRELKMMREESFSRAFGSLYERCKRCTEAGGVYIQCWYQYNFFMSFFLREALSSFRKLNCHTVLCSKCIP